MVGSTEINFPRGGRKPPSLLKLDKKSHPTFKLFGNKKKVKSKSKNKHSSIKKKNVEKERFNLDSSEVVTSTTAELLTYRTLQEGMVVLACIREVNKMGLTLSLPGRLSAKVPITHISLPYTKLLKSIVEDNNLPEDYRSLSTLFYVGQYVRCKIMESLHSDNSLYKVTASISPHDVQSDWKHVQLKKGLVITGAVSSVEDHGYVMETGIKDTRAFLPKNNVNQELEIGQVIWCGILEASCTNTTNTVVLTTKTKEVFLKTVKSVTIQDLLPGMRVSFTVNKNLSDGLEGTFLNDFTGYISYSHLEKPLQSINKYTPGDALEAYVLYVMPTTKLTCLTLSDISAKPEIDLKEGHVTTAKVLSRIGKGLYLKLSKTAKGFVSYNRLKQKNTVDKQESLNSYEIGSSQRCRILDYDYMERVYICTLEKDLVNEKYFSIHDFNIGDLVPIVVDKINANGVEVTAGRVSGFVKKLHLSDIPLQTTSVPKKFQVGQKLNARVLELNVENKDIIFTLKPSLVESKLPCLTSLDTVDKKLQYQGVIVQITNKGLLVIFYGDLRGWVPTTQLNLHPGVLVEDVFYIGQVIKCRILSVNSKAKKMTLSLRPEPKRAKTTSLRIGQVVNANIKSVVSTGIEMTINKMDGKALLPTAHLSDNLKLAPILQEQYKNHKSLEKLLCIGVTAETAYLSLRETKHFENVPSFENIKEGTLLRCSFKSFVANGLLLFSPIKKFRRYVFIPKKHIIDDILDDFKNLKLVKYQPLMAKVLAVDKGTEAIIATTKLSECWDRSLEFAVNYLSQYLIEMDTIRKMEDENSIYGLGEFKLGQRVKGKVKSISDTGLCTIGLSNNVEAVVIKDNYEGEFKIKEKVHGVVLWVDYSSKNVMVSLLNRHKNDIDEQQAILIPHVSIGTIVKCEIVLVTDDFALGVMFENEKKQFLFLPTILHYNNFTTNESDYEVGSIIFAKISKIVNNQWYIGILKVEKMKIIKRLELAEINVKKENVEVVQVKPRQILDDTTKPSKKMKKRKIEETKPNDDDDEIDNITISNSKKMHTKKAKSNLDDVILSGVGGFWISSTDEVPSNDFSKDSDDDDDKKVKPKKMRKLLKAAKLEETKSEEVRINEKEMLLADSNRTPTSAEQFDRLVLSQPNSSQIWISYMAFHLQSTEIEKARSIARKALSTISFRQEQDKLNVWVALLNLENRYGTKQSFSSVLEESAKMNDSRLIYMRALHILADSKKENEFMDLLNIVLKKYKHLPETWQQGATHCFQLGLNEKAHHLLQRALICLDKKLHIDFLVQFAYLEVKHGGQERAETLFEQVLGSYPSRVDVWCSYVDMLVKATRIDVARKVLNTAVSLQLPPRKMKTLFKKYIDFEQVNGNEEDVKKVREMAVKYVQDATT